MRPVVLTQNSDKGFLPTIKNLEKSYKYMLTQYSQQQDLLLLDSYVKTTGKEEVKHFDENLFHQAFTRNQKLNYKSNFQKISSMCNQNQRPQSQQVVTRQSDRIIEYQDPENFKQSRAQFFTPKHQTKKLFTSESSPFLRNQQSQNQIRQQSRLGLRSCNLDTQE